MESECVSIQTRQFFRAAAVTMALVLFVRNNSRDPWIDMVALITLLVDGYLFLIESKECP